MKSQGPSWPYSPLYDDYQHKETYTEIHTMAMMLADPKKKKKKNREGDEEEDVVGKIGN